MNAGRREDDMPWSTLRLPDDGDPLAIEDFVGALIGLTELKYVEDKGEILTLLRDGRMGPNLKDQLRRRLAGLADDAGELGRAVRRHDRNHPPDTSMLVVGLPTVHRPPGSQEDVTGLFIACEGETITYIDSRGRRRSGPRDQVLLFNPESEVPAPAGGDAAGPFDRAAFEAALVRAKPYCDGVGAEVESLLEKDLLGKLLAHLIPIETGLKAAVAAGVPLLPHALSGIRSLRVGLEEFRDRLRPRGTGIGTGTRPDR